MVLNVLAGGIRQEKEIKYIQMGVIKLYLHADGVTYIRDHKCFTRKFLETRNKFNNVVRYKINYESIVCLYPNNKHTVKEITSTLPFIIALKKIK